MKRFSFVFLAAGFIALTTVTAVRAATPASDVSTNYSSSTWTTGSNFGTGFQPWNLFGNSGTGGFYGNYVGGTALSSNSFGVYSGNAGTGASFDAQRPFTGAMSPGQTFSVDLGHTNIQSGGSVGLNFQSVTGGTATNQFSLIANGSTWSLNDGGTNFSVAADTTNTDYHFTFTYVGGNNYSYTLTGSSGGTNYSASSTLTNINQVQFFDFQQGGGENFGFDNLSLDVPEPSTYFGGAAMVVCGLLIVRRRARTA